MARRKNIEHLYRYVGERKDGRRHYVLVGFPNVEKEHLDEDYSDFCINHISCVDKCIEDAIRDYGRFTGCEIEGIKALDIGESVMFSYEDTFIIRIA